ncbi:MAG: family 78 glycoside hydrolase catalytic domain [Oscillospiraceae bacterium]
MHRRPRSYYGELKPVSVKRCENGWLYNFGENNTGVCRLSVNAKAGQKITLRYGEWLNGGSLCLDNIRFAQQSDLQKDFVQKKRVYLQGRESDPYTELYI